jgi:outer membrane protein assembly factor BamB
MNTFITLTAWAAVTAPAQAPARLDPLDNWHQWRGPLANGEAPRGKPPSRWDPKTNIKWKAELPGKGASTPIVWDDQVFVVTAIDTGKKADPKDIPQPDPRFDKKTTAPVTYHRWVVLSFDRKTGKERWRHTAAEAVPHEGHHDTHSYAAGSPVTDGKRLVVSLGSQGTFCYDLAGKLLWKRDLGRLHTRLGWGEAVTAVIYRDTVYVALDQEGPSALHALDAATGKTRWKVDRDEPTNWATPLVVEHQGKAQLVVTATRKVRSYDPATGKVIWECGGMTTNAIPSPVRFGDTVVCMSGYRGAKALAIRLDAKGDVTDTKSVVWTHDQGTPYVPSPLLVKGRLWFTQVNMPLLTCLDAATGKVILDRVRLSGLRTLYASPVAAAGRIYLTDRDGTTLVLEQADKVKVLAVNKLDEPIDASPALVGKQLFLRGEKHLYCIEESK